MMEEEAVGKVFSVPSYTRQERLNLEAEGEGDEEEEEEGKTPSKVRRVSVPSDEYIEFDEEEQEAFKSLGINDADVDDE
jgi:hypothetical protein